MAGSKLGPYEIVAAIGAGEWEKSTALADTRLGRDVTVKVQALQLSLSPELKQRFEREAKAISALNHPHICSLCALQRRQSLLHVELYSRELYSR